MFIYLIVILAIATRFVPHMPNFAPITALALFAGAYLSKKEAVGVTLAARFVSDVFLGFFSWPLMLAVYACHIAAVFLGSWIGHTTPSASRPPLQSSEGNAPQNTSGSLRSSPPNIGGVPSRTGGGGMYRWTKIIFSSLAGAILFFLVTNFAFLYSTYPHTWAGIMEAYINGLPFIRGTLMGDMAYAIVLFGCYEAVRYFASRKNHEHASISA